MGWLTALKSLLSIVSSLATYMGNRQLISAGEAKAVATGLKRATNAVKRAQDARRAVDHSPDSVRDDKFNRD